MVSLIYKQADCFISSLGLNNNSSGSAGFRTFQLLPDEFVRVYTLPQWCSWGPNWSTSPNLVTFTSQSWVVGVWWVPVEMWGWCNAKLVRCSSNERFWENTYAWEAWLILSQVLPLQLDADFMGLVVTLFTLKIPWNWIWLLTTTVDTHLMARERWRSERSNVSHFEKKRNTTKGSKP